MSIKIVIGLSSTIVFEAKPPAEKLKYSKFTSSFWNEIFWHPVF